jgi:hypothetical protein
MKAMVRTTDTLIIETQLPPNPTNAAVPPSIPGRQDPLVLSYLALRKAVGIIGFAALRPGSRQHDPTETCRSRKAGGPAFDFQHPRHSGCPVLRVLCEGRESGMPAPVSPSRRAIPKRNLRPAFIHSHRPGFVQKIETIAAPTPFLW